MADDEACWNGFSETCQLKFGKGGNYWLMDSDGNYDLTRGMKVPRPVELQTTKARIKVAPSRTALLIVDMQSQIILKLVG